MAAERTQSFERLPEESFSRQTAGSRGRRSVSKGTNNANASANVAGGETTPQESFTRQWTEPTDSVAPWLMLLGTIGVVGAVAGTIFINRERFFG